MATVQVQAAAETTGCLAGGDAHILAVPVDNSCTDGVVKSFNKLKGYGFVRVKNHADDVYFKTEDFTPRSRVRAQQASGIAGAPIMCTPEIFARGGTRARSVRLIDEATRANLVESATLKAAELDESSVNVAPTISKAALARPAIKKATPARARGWGAPVHSQQKAELMKMGFSEEAADDALASGLDFNTVLDTLLTSDPPPSMPARKPSCDSLPTTGSASELDSCLTTRAGSDDSSDNTSACDSVEKSPEAVSIEPDIEIASAETDSEVVIPAPPDELELPLELSFAIPDCNEMVEAGSAEYPAEAANKETVAAPARQLARVLDSLPEGCAAEGVLSVQPGTLIYVWADSATEHGWIYAERLDKGNSAGWIPADLLKLLRPSLQWRSAAKNCPSFSDQHLAAHQGDVILVDTQSVEQAAEGAWVCAESLDGTQAGWFPAYALAKFSEKQRWLRVSKTQMALHDSQASVERDDLVLVDLDTRTKEGWAYAWAADRQHAMSKGGWVPVNCLEWPQEQ